MVAEPGLSAAVGDGINPPVPVGPPMELGGEVEEGGRRGKRRYSPQNNLPQAQAQTQSGSQNESQAQA